MISTVQLCKALEVLGYGTYPGKEKTMENKMGHFIGWEFGVPVKVSSRNSSSPYTDQVLLIQETDNTFIVKFKYFIKEYNKAVCCYELIPYKYGRAPYSPRYPVCKSNSYIAFCNSSDKINCLDSAQGLIFKEIKQPTATLNIDGKTIELSVETTAELKKKLGV